MIVRDLGWRTVGAAMILAGCASAGIARPSGSGPGFALAGFVVAIFGIVLVVQGGRIRRALRIERSRHRHLPALMHDHRVRRGDDRQG